MFVLFFVGLRRVCSVESGYVIVIFVEVGFIIQDLEAKAASCTVIK